jgi:ribosome maturation protein SDO1
MASNPTLARIKKHGMNFEISVDPDKALEYKKGNASLREVLLADNIFSDAKRGEIAKESDLQTAFETTDTDKIADIILTKGEIQLTSDHRAEEREKKKKQLIHFINVNAVDPKTGLPHPPTRIELALEQGKITLDYNKTVEEQLDEIISKLRPIIPISIQKKKLQVVIPANYAGKAYQPVKDSATILKDEWGNDGSWTVTVEIPAGLYPDFIQKMNGLTSGEVTISEV